VVSWRRVGLVFVGVGCLYALVDSGRIQTIDVQQSVAVSKAIAAHATVAVSGLVANNAGGVVRGVHGSYYSFHDIGLALIFLPVSLLLAVHAIGSQAATFLYTLVDPVFGAATVVLFYVFELELTERRRTALLASAVLAVCTIVFPYSHFSFDAAPTGFFVLLSTYSAWRFERSLRSRHMRISFLILSSVAAGCAVLVRSDSALFVAVECVWVAVLLAGTGTWSGRSRVAAAWLVPLISAGVVTLWYNDARFGSVFDDGHRHDVNLALTTPVWRGAAGLLLSPGKGLVFFVPPVVAAAFGWRWLYRRSKALVLVPLASLALYCGFEGRFASWSGAQAWGPRFLVPLVAILLVPLAGVLCRWKELRGTRRVLVALLVALGFAVQVPGVLTDDVALDQMHGDVASDQLHARDAEQQAAWHSSQILYGWGALVRSARGQDPYPSTLHGGIVAPPVPPVDLWWADAYTFGASDPSARWTLVGVLFFVCVASVSMACAKEPETARRIQPGEGNAPASAT
jgi:hypothetical protein